MRVSDEAMDRIDAVVRVVSVVWGLFVACLAMIVGIEYLRDVDSYTCQDIAVSAEPGDDYWGYAEKYCEGNIIRITDDLVEAYGLILPVGKTIYLPQSDKCKIYTEFNGNTEHAYEVCE